jgi:hypothetical protein
MREVSVKNLLLREAKANESSVGKFTCKEGFGIQDLGIRVKAPQLLKSQFLIPHSFLFHAPNLRPGVH